MYMYIYIYYRERARDREKESELYGSTRCIMLSYTTHNEYGIAFLILATEALHPLQKGLGRGTPLCILQNMQAQKVSRPNL